MACDYPMTAWWSKVINPATGKRLITFKRDEAFFGVDKPLSIPCGQCTGCRLAHSQMWGVRCMHEKMLHSESSFVTLTYDDGHLPSDGSLSKVDHTQYMYRLREHIKRKRGKVGLRFYMCGEYGSLTNRPHYHYLYFNHDFDDKKFVRMSKTGEKLYTSKFLTELWPFGSNIIGDVTLESCCYVARYITDKITGDRADDWYMGRVPEFVAMSRRPGIASDWYERFGRHSHYSGDHVVVAGKRIKMPRFYDTRFEVVDERKLAVLKSIRRRKARHHALDNTVDRRKVRRIVRDARNAQFRREF